MAVRGVERLSDFARANFSPAGFNMEQSPFYHWYTLIKLDEIVAYLNDVGAACPADLQRTLERAVGAWRRLLRADQTLPTIGDTDTRSQSG